MGEPHEHGVLDRVLRRVREVRRAALDPVVVFDLDYTLFDNAPRTLAILNVLAERHYERFPGMRRRVQALSVDGLPFDHSEVIRLLGPEVEPHVRTLKDELAGLFFSSRFLDCDVPLAGAREFVATCRHAGATIVYLTGRDRVGMGDGTVASLQAHGFPLSAPRVHLIMKPDTVTPDVIFKSGVHDLVRRHGELVAFFDNEPGNVNGFKEAFPACIAVLMETKCQPGAPPPARDVERIRDFRPATGTIPAACRALRGK
jgi:hypothetical protein